MSKETLINEPVVASIIVDCSGRGEAPGSTSSEFDRISAGLQAICDPSQDHLFMSFGRAHKVVPTRPADRSKGTLWRPTADGGGEAQIVLYRVDQPAQRVRLDYKLVRAAGDRSTSGWLTADCNPTTILAGNNIHPATIANPEIGDIRPYPSSDLTVMRKMHRLGFNVLEDLCQQVMNTDGPLFHPDTRALIDSGAIHLIRVQWCAYLPTPDVPRFLQRLTALTGHHIRRGKGLIHLADHLGFSFEPHKHERKKTDDLTGVTLKKKHGNKPLWSLVFYDKQQRIADMKQGKTLAPAEVATIGENVRFDITAHSEGIIAIATAARTRLRRMLKRGIVRPGKGWIKRFLGEEIKPTTWWLEAAIFILSHRLRDRVLVRRSFAEWLVPYMINNTLRLDVITGFTRDNFHRLVALEDKVAVAWRADERAEPKGWAARLAKKARCSVQTVYTRQNEWLQEYGIDIAVPHAFYRDLLFFGPASLTQPRHRSDLINAVRERNGGDAIRLHERAARDFDRWRTEDVGATIKSRPHRMEIKVARETPLAAARACIAGRPHPAITAQAPTGRMRGSKTPITITARALATVHRPRAQLDPPKTIERVPRQNPSERRAGPGGGRSPAPPSSHARRR